MEFLTQMPPAQLVECATKHTCFIAELFAPRPPWHAILAYRETMRKLQASVEELAARGNCPFAQLGIYVDHEGACLLATPKKEMQLCHARSGLSTLLQPLDLYEEGAQVTSRKRMEKTVRPFDALDKTRLDAWKTATHLRPAFPKAPKPEKEETALHTRLHDFLAAASESEDEDIGPPTLAIADEMVAPQCPPLCDGDLALYQEAHAHAYAKWSESVQRAAVVVMLTVGELKELSFIPCHREERRVQFLVAKLHDLPDLAETCVLAAELAREGLLPSPSGSRARKGEFLKRCQAALGKKNPLAELDVKQVPAEDQRAIALALQPDQKLCSTCPGQAKTSLEFSLSWWNGVPEPDPDTKWFCSACAPLHAAVCPSCGKRGTLVQDGELLHSSSPLVLSHHRFSNLRCTDCKRAAVAPFTAAEKRKVSELLGAELRSKRMCM